MPRIRTSLLTLSIAAAVLDRVLHEVRHEAGDPPGVLGEREDLHEGVLEARDRFVDAEAGGTESGPTRLEFGERLFEVRTAIGLQRAQLLAVGHEDHRARAVARPPQELPGEGHGGALASREPLGGSDPRDGRDRAGRADKVIAAEIGTMKVTEELDAVRTLGISPINLLVLPRALALVIAGSYVLNDVCDRRADRINAPARPIPARVSGPAPPASAGETGSACSPTPSCAHPLPSRPPPYASPWARARRIP